MAKVRVPDIIGPRVALCWRQDPDTLVRCDRQMGHQGDCSWKMAAALAALRGLDTVYELRGGTSVDGSGPGHFLRWTFDKAEADKHAAECRANPYSTGGVRVLSNRAAKEGA